jgi:hypothetical protein
MALVKAAADSKADGELTLSLGGKDERVYYHWFYSAEKDYTMFMGVEEKAIDMMLDVNGVVIPISAIGLLMLFMAEYIIWLKLEDAKAEGGEARNPREGRNDNEDGD